MIAKKRGRDWESFITIVGLIVFSIVKISEAVAENPPVFKPTRDKGAVIGRKLELKVEAVDPDDPQTPEGQLVYSVEAADPLFPPGALFAPDTQLFSWTPTLEQSGEYQAIFKVRDSTHTVSMNVSISTAGIKETCLVPRNSGAFEPDIYADTAIWQDWASGKASIMLYDTLTGGQTQLTSVTYNRFEPRMDGDLIVFTERNAAQTTSDVVYYNMASGAEVRVTNDSAFQAFPNVGSNKIVWWERGKNGVTLFDIGTGLTSFITNYDLYETRFPYVWGSKVVWQDYTSYGRGSILIYDIPSKAISLLTTNAPIPSSSLRMMAYRDNRIVWVGSRNSENNIYLYDFTNTTQTQITTMNSFKMMPSIQGNRIVWADERHGDRKIYLFDLETNKEICISGTERNFDYKPEIYGNKIVWESSSSCIQCMAEFFYKPQINSLRPAVVPVNNTLTITGKNFGAEQGDSSIIFTSDVAASIQSWSDTAIQCIVPPAAVSGEVFVSTMGGKSNTANIVIGGILYGDVSGDGAVSAYDAALAAQAAVGLITLTQEQITKADVSGDGAVSAYDAALIAQKAVGLISKFPVEGEG